VPIACELVVFEVPQAASGKASPAVQAAAAHSLLIRSEIMT